MRYQVVTSQVRVIGGIWWPYGATAAMDMSPGADEVRDEDGNITRESVAVWLILHSHDFSSLYDFSADIADGDTDVVIPWQSEDSEMVYADCMYGDEE